MKEIRRHIRTLLILLLMFLGGTAHNVWATDVTYHILTLPIDPTVYDYKMKPAITGWRLEAVKVVEKGQSTLELPAHYKSPLATGFKYYKAADVSKYNSGAAQNLFDNGPIKGVLYMINGEATPEDAADDATPVSEGTTLSGNTAEYYVVYTYNASNTIAQLDGSVRYNIGFKNKGFLSYNRGRNNRPAVVPKGKVDPAMLASEDFMKVDVTGSGITAYWSHGDNKNNVEITGSNFHFMFKFEGYDPYNIIIRTAYDRDLTYIEKNDNTSDFVYKYYKEGSFFTNGTAKGYIASDEHRHYNMPYNSSLSENPTNLVEGAAGDHTGYDAMTGYYHGQNATMWNSFALLNNSGNSGYVFMGTRTVNGSGTIPGPTNDGKYYYLKAENNDLFIAQQTLADVTKNYSTEGIYPIKKVTFKVATPFYSVDPSEDHIVSVADWVSQYTVKNNPIETQYLPETLKRKYCSFREKFYKDPECTQEITHFNQANYDNTEGYKVYLAYDVSESVPFKAITPSDSYTADTWRAATWYELTDKDETTDKKIKYDGTTYFKNNGATNTYEKVSEYAFIGDPYELRVILRSETSGTTPSYLGATGTPTSGTALKASTDATAGYKWEIPLDNTDGSMLLRKFNGEGHWYWNTEGDDQNVTYSTESSTRVKVLTLPERDFTYNIVDKAGRIAVQATISQTIFSPLNGYASIPEVIRSPFLSDETVTFYSSYSGGGRGYLSSPITELTGGNPASSTNVYVKYTTTHLNTKSIHLNAEDPNQQFNVKLNGSYIYYDSGSNKIMSNASATTEQLATDPYLWYLRNRDPYAMLIDNIAARTDLSVSGKENVTVYNDDGYSVQDDGTTPATLDPDTRPLRDKGAWVRVDGGSWGNDKALVFTSTRTDASRFIAMMSKNIGVYEVMVATGDDTYYHIGRATGTDTDTKIYSVNTAGFAHGDNALRFELFGKVPITYTLIDKAGNELLDVSSNNPRLALPAEFVSPLVETYYYYPTKAKAISALTANKVDPNSGDAITEIDSDTQEDDTTPGDSHVWVTYKVNNLVDFNDNNSSYLLKFLHPFDAGYYLEDGNDKLTTEKIQAIYPYTNGDGSLNIYGQKMNEEQMGGGAATRPRWVWFFESDNDDPYHVKIHSKSTISYNSITHPTYLQTYAVHFKQDANEKKQRIVNGGALPGIASTEPTEYMILGVAGKFKLMTTNPVKADLNGDGDTDDTIDGVSENARRSVTSFEQYWKTYNMVKLHVLGISKSTDAFSNDESTWVVPTADDPSTGGVDESTYRATLAARDWHSYDVIANATRWNGYNDKSDGGHEKKCVEKLEHWFQTFDMGDGEFAIESAVIPPVLVLLDRHGWEIMRQPLPPVSTYPNGDDQLKALRVFDSPMVDKYYFYSNATKASGCHKYTLRMQDGKERDQIKVNGEHYSSTSLGTLPPKTATGVLSGGAIQDFYVTYTVKEEYEKSYKYVLDYDEIKDGDGKVTGYTLKSETGTPSKFVIVQNGRYARKEINEEKSYLSKPVPQATNPTGGNVYDMILNPSQVTIGNIIVDTNADGIIDDDNLWYVQPNLNIDNEMGIVWGTAISGAEPLSEVATKVAYKDKTGFDPYNLQLKNALSDRFYTSAISSTRLHNGIWEGTLGSAGIELKTATTSGYVTPEGYDHTILQITNQTFMAVSDANGNMQLMPRFDHTKRINVTSGGSSRTTLQDPVDHTEAVVTDNASMGPQTVFMVRPRKFEYHIIDHDGNEALRYKTAGEYSPSIPNRYKSPLATDFKYYYGTTEKVISDAGSYAIEWANAEEIYKRTALTDALVTSQADYLPITGDYYFRIGTDPASYTYKKVTVTKVKEINQLFADAGLNAGVNQVYVRYSFDEEATDNEILRGKWFTINLANKDVQSSGTIVTTVGASQGTGVDLYAGNTTPASDDNDKPATIDADDKKWQWKFLASPTDISSPYYRPIDPYAIQIFNRSANYSDNLAAEPNPMSIGIKVGGYDRFALLSHPNEGYALAVAGAGLSDPSYNYTYTFLNGAKMTTPSTTAASIVEESFQKSINVDDYTTFKTTLASGPDAVYYVKLNGKEVDEKPVYKKVTVTSNAIAGEDTSNATEWEKSYISIGAQLVFNNDVTHTYTYHVINNGHKLAVSGTQTNDEAASHNLTPYTPESIQTPLLNEDDYKYYGSVIIDKNGTPDDPSDDTYTVVDATKLFTLYGLYDDVAYVRYEDYDMDKTEYLVPNKRNTPGTTVARDPESQDVALNIKGELPYNIIWESDNMMKKGDGDAIGSDPDKALDGDGKYVWQFEGEDPYALKIKHKAGDKYVNGTGTLGSAKEFMLLRKSGYDYGILQETGGTNMLSGYGNELVGSNPTKFIIFGLSTHKVIYHLVINTTNVNTTIPYRTGTESSPGSLEEKEIPGTTQRDLTSSIFGVPGDRYQLGTTFMGQTYCVDAGEVSIGDVLEVPNEFSRPNCNFFFYVDNVQTKGNTDHQVTVASESAMNTSAASLEAVGDYYYKIENQYIYRKIHVTEVSPVAYEISASTESEWSSLTAADETAMITAADALAETGDYYYKVGPLDIYKRVQVTTAKVGETPAVYSVVDCSQDDWSNAWQDNETLNGKYKGLEITKLMSDAGLIGGLVKINVAYAFETGLETNAGEGFVTSVDQNLWYTYETQDGTTPYLAHYTNAWGLQAMAGRDTRYTNDYLWTPLGDVYGFKMYNRYMIKNSGGVAVMTMPSITEGTNLKMAVPGSDGIPLGNEVFELLSPSVVSSGYFKIHPVVNKIGTQYYIRKDPADNYAKISSTNSEWTFNLPSDLLKPYIERKGYVGGLTEDAYSTNKTVLDKVMNGTASYADMLTIQGIVYNDANIVSYTPGYYRLHSQPGVSGISPVRYASGYLHDIEKTDISGGIPMHFYSKAGVTTTFSGLKSGFTVTNATRGEIPVPATEYDPSSVFYFNGNTILDGNPRSTMQTQGLYVAANPMGDTTGGENEKDGKGTNRLQRAVMVAPNNDNSLPSNVITFSLMDIGGAVLLIHDGAVPAQRRYLNFDQSNTFQKTATDDTDMTTQAPKFTSKGTYYFKIGESSYTYKKITVTSGYVAGPPATNAVCAAAESSTIEEWNKAADIYDLKYYHDSPTDDAKWCMEPANNKGLQVAVNNGGDDYYYATFCVPYDVKLPDNDGTKTYYAYICDEWDDNNLHPTKVPKVTGTPSYDEGKFVPASTPVIFRIKDESGNMKLTIEGNTPSDPLPSSSNIFSGKYLEQLLIVDASHDVYTLGLPFTTPVTIDRSKGAITAELPEKANSGLGFYINATPNKENAALQSLWLRNNRYVLHNKIYYRATVIGGARETTRGIDFVPVIFDEENGEEPDIEHVANGRSYPLGVYDLLGRCVATEEEVKDGSWRQRVAPGVYIVHGKKVMR